MRFLLSFLFFHFMFASFSQLNIDSLSHIDYNTLHSTFLNDVWGYTDELGNEYGLIGTEDGVSIIDLSTPSNPTEVFWEAGTHSIWRDLKTYHDYAYVTTEALSGLMIIDLTSLPTVSIPAATYYNGPLGQEWQSAHNIYIDTASGFAYIFGANRGNNGVIILDLATDPLHPVEVGQFDNWYVHDGYVRNDTMFLSHIYEGFLSMVDVTDKTNPILLGTQATPSTFCHNVWANSNGQYAFTTDEVSGGYIGAFDVSDPTNIVEIDRIKSSPDVGYVIPHNTHVKGSHLVTSYYSDGIVLHDITYPYNMIEVGNYDTYPSQTPNYDGCWGAYPFFSSGLILASDRTEGLFILSPNYVQACYLEGNVTDMSSGTALLDVDVSVVLGIQNELTNSTGFYATGAVSSGSYDVTYSKVGFYPQTINLSMTAAAITVQDVQLVPIPQFGLTIVVLDELTNMPIIGTDIKLKAPLIEYLSTSNGIGEEYFSLFYNTNYTLTVGKWGYVSSCSNIYIDSITGVVTVLLTPGYYDDFTFDFGWSVIGSATTGMWKRGKPIGTTSGSAPSDDVITDCGNFAYVTGNSSNQHPDFDDVDKGTTTLISPIMDLTSIIDPYVTYSRWFYSNYGSSSYDSLKTIISNGFVFVELERVGRNPATWDQWVDTIIRLQDYITITNNMQFFFTTSDIDPEVNITEAGIDLFKIIPLSAVEIEELGTQVILFPNPTNGILNIEGETVGEKFIIMDLNGKIVRSGSVNSEKEKIDLTDLKNGLYFFQIQNKVSKIIKE